MTLMSHDLAGLSHERLLSTITRTLGVSSGFDKAEIDSYYTRASGVRPVRIETYPKRRRSGRVESVRTTAGAMPAAAMLASAPAGSSAAASSGAASSVAGSSALVDAGPSYADFFAQPHAMTA